MVTRRGLFLPSRARISGIFHAELLVCHVALLFLEIASVAVFVHSIASKASDVYNQITCDKTSIIFHSELTVMKVNVGNFKRKIVRNYIFTHIKGVLRRRSAFWENSEHWSSATLIRQHGILFAWDVDIAPSVTFKLDVCQSMHQTMAVLQDKTKYPPRKNRYLCRRLFWCYRRQQ